MEINDSAHHLLTVINDILDISKRGSIILRTRIIEESDQDVVLLLEVRDTGVSIVPEARERLFQAFEQADNSITRQYGGTGLGLAITRRLVELMGGGFEYDQALQTLRKAVAQQFPDLSRPVH
ncbi:MAG TPA: ATP-binding protein [Candidatus Competibacteraceae bacterium]|nr:ATP-binding protein [Candidatus Competibacteraceae bacterium]HRZ08091.1 ATP-binding protein [Candidatus Competibacteraceae bacterium]HSA47178.1 ATP-binding protein [Candidatus Competibacteraceae bacterium]